MSRAVLSLGSNLGDREATILGAVDDLALVDGITVDAVSGFVETAAVKPHGVDETAPAYLNVVALITTNLAPHELLGSTSRIENARGRVRVERWGDRTLDIDIVSYDDVVMESDDLVLPHPRAAEREFVLVPWLEVDPHAQLPGIGRIDVLPAARIAVRRYPGEDLVKRTRPLLLVLYAVFGGALGWMLQIVLTASAAPAAIPPYSLALALVVIGVLVIVAARPVRRAVRDRARQRIDPFYATRVVILAKAVSIAGSVLFGAALGLLVFFLTRPVIPGVGSILACVATAVGAAVLLACGLVAEYMCSLPPDDDDRGDRSPVTTTPH